MASKKVLLTGFEPFGGASFNPSGAVVEEIAEHGIDGVEIVTAVLPVEFKRSAKILIDLITTHKPSVVIGVNAKISYSAGAFICNEIFFTAQSFLQGSNVMSGFIHLPLAPNQAAEFPGLPTMPIADQVAAIKAAIQVSIDV